MGGMKKGQAGTSLGGRIEKSPDRRAREQRAREQQDKRWASRSGKVTVRRIDENPDNEEETHE